MPMSTNDLGAQNRVVTFNGERVTVPADVTDVSAFVKAENKRRGIATFVALVAGRELNSITEINDAVAQGGVLEIRTYAKPGRVS